MAYDPKLDDMLDRTLEDGAKQHNLTAVNVRNILHVSPVGSYTTCTEASIENRYICPRLLLRDGQFCPLYVTHVFHPETAFSLHSAHMC